MAPATDERLTSETATKSCDETFRRGRGEARGEAGKAYVKASDMPTEVGDLPRHSLHLSKGGELARDASADLEGMAIEAAAGGKGPIKGGDPAGDSLA